MTAVDYDDYKDQLSMYLEPLPKEHDSGRPWRSYPQDRSRSGYDASNPKHPYTCDCSGCGAYAREDAVKRASARMTDHVHFSVGPVTPTETANTKKLQDYLNDTKARTARMIAGLRALPTPTPKATGGAIDFEKIEATVTGGGYRFVRLWKLDGLDLASFAHRYVWQPGINEIGEGQTISSVSQRGAGFHGWFGVPEMLTQERDAVERAVAGVPHQEIIWTYSDTDLDDNGFHKAISVPHEYYNVIGTVMGWGEAVQCTKGIRTQYALPESLVLTNDFDFNLRLMEVGEKYGINLISQDDVWNAPLGFVEGWSIPAFGEPHGGETE